LDFIRIELRNAVHNARTYTRLELIHYSNTVISGYLIAVEDNLNSLKRKFLKEYTYLEKIVLESDYKNLDKMYVDLLGQEAIKDIEVYGVEVIDENELLLDVNSFNGFNSKLLLDEDIDYKLVEKRIDNIINIANDTKQFHIVGKPGSGKSTTLLKMEIMMNETTPFRRKLTPLFRGKLTRAFRAN
jgi:predicted NACHT family NTPase